MATWRSMYISSSLVAKGRVTHCHSKDNERVVERNRCTRPGALRELAWRQQITVRALLPHLSIGAEDLSRVVDSQRDEQREGRGRNQLVEVPHLALAEHVRQGVVVVPVVI